MSSQNEMTRRMPLSCEPCRKRKIKCEKDAVPCATCVRRGYSTRCTYQRLQEDTNEKITMKRGTESASDSELRDRICFLEAAVLQGSPKRARASTHRLPSPGLSSDDTPTSLECTSEGTETTFSPSRISVPSFWRPNIGSHRIVVSPSGHERFELGHSPWSSSARKVHPANLTRSAPNRDSFCDIFNFVQGLTRRELLALLPSKDHCVQLKDNYLSVFSPLFHILHDPTFEADFQRFQNDPEGVETVWLALLFVVLALAVTALEDDDSLLANLGRLSSSAANRDSLAAQYRSYALKCLIADDFTAQHNLKTLQTLVLLIYALNHAHRPSFALLGLAQNIAFAIGAHVDPEHFAMSALQSEERRRCWAALIMLRTIQHSTLFMTETQGFHNDVKLPADMDDVDLANGQTPEKIQPRRQPTQMTYILFKFGLYEILANICQLVYNTSSGATTRFNVLHSIDTLDRRIALEQEKWAGTFQMCPQLPIHHLVHLQILHMYAHQLFLLLHRPCAAFDLARRSGRGENDVKRGESAAQRSRARCVHSAVQILQIHTAFDESDHFRPYHWYHRGLGSFHAFHGFAVLAAALLSNLPESEYNHTSMPLQTTRVEILAILHESLERFSPLQGKSEICRRAFPVMQTIWDEITRIHEPMGGNWSRQTSGVFNRQKGTTSGDNATAEMRTDINFPDHHQFRSPDEYEFSGIGASRGEEDMAFFDSLLKNLQPEYWLTPLSDPWERWNQGSGLLL